MEQFGLKVYKIFTFLGTGTQLTVNFMKENEIISILRNELQCVDLNNSLNEDQKKKLAELIEKKEDNEGKKVIQISKQPPLSQETKPKQDIQDRISKAYPNSQSLKEQTKEIESQKVPTLDELFQKTKTKPVLYFLPNTDKELLEKRRKELKEIKSRMTQRSRSR